MNIQNLLSYNFYNLFFSFDTLTNQPTVSQFQHFSITYIFLSCLLPLLYMNFIPLS